MKTIKKNVYYCDFCKKKGLSAGAMAKHEKHCTGNVNRKCRMCDSQGLIGEIIEDLKTRFKIVQTKPSSLDIIYPTEEVQWIGKEITLDEISDRVDDCPNCILAILRLSGISHYAFTDIIDFKYQDRVSEYWSIKNADHPQYGIDY
jgi:hypothetical protein